MSELQPQLVISVDDLRYAIQVAPKALGERDGIWSPEETEIDIAGSLCDGRSNTQAMALAGSEAALWALSLTINDQTDWYLPSRDELELLYRHYKPTPEPNYAYRAGGNLSSVPIGNPYTEQVPAQTIVEGLRNGEADAFDGAWYWSSTYFSRSHAWLQSFANGSQSYNMKSYQGRVRAVRRVLLP